MKLILLFVMLSGLAFGGDRSFWRDNRVPLAVDGGARVADAAVTCAVLSRGWHEAMIPTQRCIGVAAWSAGSWGLATGVSYLLHRTGHYRLSRWVPLVDAGFPAYGLGFTAYQATQPRRKPMLITATWSMGKSEVHPIGPVKIKGR